ncbi:ATP-binding protein [Streptomyces sp. NPDC059582]|uniref:ATP-binding protein n=1 Tax=Streptomyces sp. NPDC059582 TaxID=3346875 RepID=UPI0036790BA8
MGAAGRVAAVRAACQPVSSIQCRRSPSGPVVRLTSRTSIRYIRSLCSRARYGRHARSLAGCPGRPGRRPRSRTASAAVRRARRGSIRAVRAACATRVPSCFFRSSPSARTARRRPWPLKSPFAEWDKTFGDPRLCTAIADRITFRCTLIQTGTESYRFRITEAERRGFSPGWKVGCATPHGVGWTCRWAVRTWRDAVPSNTRR